jgi:Transposase Tn5 dimerisation domain/Transposase DNA-binding
MKVMTLPSWILDETKEVNFGDKRLNKRFEKILNAMANQPNETIPTACKTWNETIAAYRFFDNEEVTKEKILSPHFEATLKRIKAEKVVLLAQDTTEIDFSHRQAIEGMGLLRSEQQQGFYLHPTLAITPQKSCLGIVNGHMWCRDALVGRNTQNKKPFTEKESYRWLEGFEIAEQIANECPSTLIVNVADREGDIYELLMQQTANARKAHWLIRSCFNRSIFSSEDTKLKSKLHDQVRLAPVIGEVEFIVSNAPKKKNQKAIWKELSSRKERKVTQEIRVERINLVPPDRKGMHLPKVTVYVVHCVEINPPTEEEKIEWFLLTSIPIASTEQAIEIVQWYMCRWQIEIFFKILKSGCKIEELQFDSFKNVSNCIAMYMIIAWRILYITMLGRTAPDIPCSDVFEENEWHSVYGIVMKREPPKKPPSLNDMVRMIASLGGFLGRKGDGNPGPKVMWIGMQRMKDFSIAWEAFRSLKATTYV